MPAESFPAKLTQSTGNQPEALPSLMQCRGIMIQQCDEPDASIPLPATSIQSLFGCALFLMLCSETKETNASKDTSRRDNRHCQSCSARLVTVNFDPETNQSKRTNKENIVARKKLRTRSWRVDSLAKRLDKLASWKSVMYLTSQSRILGCAKPVYSSTIWSTSQPDNLRTTPTTHPVRCFPHVSH